MAERETSEPNSSSVSPEQLLLGPFRGNLDRSVSATPSYRSHVTVIEDNDVPPESGASDPEKEHVCRQKTFQVTRNIRFLDRVKGVFFPQSLLSKIENSIEIVHTDTPDEERYHRHRSPYHVDIYVSPKYNSSNFFEARCILDTGCSNGNIVSKDLVQRLGYSDSDYQPLRPLERHGETATGEPFAIDGAILLSWHHNTSTKRYRQMRFLVSAQSNFEVIIGAQTIDKYNLLSRPVFTTLSSIHNIASKDKERYSLVDERGELKSALGNVSRKLRAERGKSPLQQNARTIENLEREEKELGHRLALKNLDIKTHDAEFIKDQQSVNKLREERKKVMEDWDKKNPPKDSASAEAEAQSSQKRPNSVEPSLPTV